MPEHPPVWYDRTLSDLDIEPEKLDLDHNDKILSVVHQRGIYCVLSKRSSQGCATYYRTWQSVQVFLTRGRERRSSIDVGTMVGGAQVKPGSVNLEI